jgi:L-threonylcarbamoyladenylate synthase
MLRLRCKVGLGTIFKTMATSSSSYRTQVLPCDPDSISFPPNQLDPSPSSATSASTASTAPTISSPSTQASLSRAAEELRAGRLVALPTETVYGLAASALSTQGVSSIFSAKGRPADNPLIVHISSLSMLHALLPPGVFAQLPKSYGKLMERFWPGALTLLFPTSVDQVPNEVTAGLGTVAVRMPSHPVARALIEITGLPLAAPSANRSSRPSPTTAQHVLDDLDGRLAVILDGGECGLGIESTVVDGLPHRPPGGKEEIRVLRPGGVSIEEMRDCLRGEDVDVRVLGKDEEGEMREKPSTPGMKYKHYSPRAKVVLVEPAASIDRGSDSDKRPWASFNDLVGSLLPAGSGGKSKIGFMLVDDSPIAKASSVDSDSEEGFDRIDFPLGPSSRPELHAQRLFAGLRALDELGCVIIFVEKVSEDGIGLAVVERAKKAAGGEVVSLRA